MIKSSTRGSKKLIEDPAIRAWLCCLPIYELAGRLKKSTCLNLLSRNTSAALQIKSSHYYKLRKPSRLCNPFYCFQMKPFGSSCPNFQFYGFLPRDRSKIKTRVETLECENQPCSSVVVGTVTLVFREVTTLRPFSS